MLTETRCEICGLVTPFLFQLKDEDFPTIPISKRKLCRRCFPSAVRYFVRKKRERDKKLGEYIPPEAVVVVLPSWTVSAK